MKCYSCSKAGKQLFPFFASAWHPGNVTSGFSYEYIVDRFRLVAGLLDHYVAWPLQGEEVCLYHWHGLVVTEVVKHIDGFQTEALLIFGVGWAVVFQRGPWPMRVGKDVVPTFTR